MPTTANIEILHRDDLPLGGFAGLREHRLVQDRKAWGDRRGGGAWQGIGNFVYLADARFLPHGETGMHPHHEIDVISIMVAGRIAHGGSLADGQALVAPDVQVQRAGGEGFQHNEVNPDAAENRALQLWVLPDAPGQAAGYQVHRPGQGVTRVYGDGGNDTFSSRTTIDVAMLAAGAEVQFDGPFLAYLSQGRGTAGDKQVTDGDLIRGDNLSFKAIADVQLTIVQSLD